MEPLLNTFDKRTRKKIEAFNLLDAALWYVKQRNFNAFIKEYKKISPGLNGLLFFGNRLKLLLRRRRLTLVKAN